MKPLPKPKAVQLDGEWVVHYPGTYSKHNPLLHSAYMMWLHANWTRSRIMRTV